MLSALTMVASLSVGFPEVPVGPMPQVVGKQDQAAREERERERMARDQLQGQDVDGRPRRRYPAFQVRALATAGLPMKNDPEFVVGFRGEVDILRASALVSLDRQGFTPISLSEAVSQTSYWNGMGGYSVLATRHSRIRLLAGLSAVSSRGYTQVGPSLGATARMGIPILSAELAAIYTPAGGFRQVDARAELVVRLLILELRGGYRARFIESLGLSERVQVESTGGPSIALGLVF